MSAHCAASAGVSTLKPAASAFLAVAEPGRSATRTSAHAAVLEVLRMGMALAAIADDGDLLGLDQVHVGIAIVIDTHGAHGSLARRIRSASGPRAMATTPVRPTSTRPSGCIRLMKASIFSRRAGHLEDEALDRGIDHAGAEDVGEAQRLDALLAGARDLDQRQLALDDAGPRPSGR